MGTGELTQSAKEWNFLEGPQSQADMGKAAKHRTCSSTSIGRLPNPQALAPLLWCAAERWAASRHVRVAALNFAGHRWWVAALQVPPLAMSRRLQCVLHRGKRGRRGPGKDGDAPVHEAAHQPQTQHPMPDHRSHLSSTCGGPWGGAMKSKGSRVPAGADGAKPPGGESPASGKRTTLRRTLRYTAGV